jgi:hypothetical protein
VPSNAAGGSDETTPPGISTVAERNGAENEIARQRSHSSTGS